MLDTLYFQPDHTIYYVYKVRNILFRIRERDCWKWGWEELAHARVFLRGNQGKGMWIIVKNVWWRDINQLKHLLTKREVKNR